MLQRNAQDSKPSVEGPSRLLKNAAVLFLTLSCSSVLTEHVGLSEYDSKNEYQVNIKFSYELDHFLYGNIQCFLCKH